MPSELSTFIVKYWREWGEAGRRDLTKKIQARDEAEARAKFHAHMRQRSQKAGRYGAFRIVYEVMYIRASAVGSKV